MISLLRPALSLFLVLSVITGFVYPIVVTGLAQAFFSKQANGSLIFRSGQPVGSELIGQQFVSPKHFWGRPSATSPGPYNALASSGSNLGPANPALSEAVKERIRMFEQAQHAHSSRAEAIPVDLVTASSSGLDPHISAAGAFYQVGRVAKVCHLSQDEVSQLVDRHVEKPLWGVLGEPRVNVLKLNLALDQICA